MRAESDARNSCLSIELYVIADEGLVGEVTPRLLEAVIQGGADAVQFRSKRLSKRDYYEKALLFLPIVRKYGALFFVNDHLDVALAISADGVHLGQGDLPCEAARRLVPSHMLLGISSHNLAEAEKAAADGADYVAIGSVFPTGTKENPEAIVGTETVARVRRGIGDRPLVAIGGINTSNAAEVIRAGADGVAVASAVVSAEDPFAAARELKEIIRVERDRKG